MRIVRMALAALVLGSALLPVQAHHSAAMYDFRKVAETTGVVKAVRVINPHMSLTLEVGDAKSAKDVEFEGHSLNNFYRAGWRPNMIKVGDKIKVRFAPRKDQEPGGFVSAFVTSDGREVAFKIPTEATAPPPAAPGSPNK
jgi:Family of unknown function (DUF6152)